MQHDPIPYVITKKRLTAARADQLYTLTIMLGTVWTDDTHYLAKLHLPATSYSDGMIQYREFVRNQRRSRKHRTPSALKHSRPRSALRPYDSRWPLQYSAHMQASPSCI